MMDEFEWIAALQEQSRALPDQGFEGIGDDCALLEIGSEEMLCYTADLMVEGVHFLREAASPEEVARKLLHVNLSDVASMGLRPVATILSVALPREVMTSEWAKRFMEAYIAASQEAQVALIGGDTTASLRDIALNVTAIGRGQKQHVKRRKDGQTGDIIAVTAPLGGSAAGLSEILAGKTESPLARLHKNPTAQIEVGLWLGAHREVHAMMDLSDGLYTDLPRMLEASKRGGEVWLDQLPIYAGATLEQALLGGEDYQLLFTADSDSWPQLQADFEARFERSLYAIGRIGSPTESPTPRWLENGVPVSKDWQTFRHF